MCTSITEPSPDCYAAHTISHRNIVVENNQETEGDNNNDINVNVATVIGSSERASIYIPMAGSNTGKIVRNTIESDRSIPQIDETSAVYQGTVL